MTEASEQTKLEAREEVTNGVRNGQVEKTKRRGMGLVALGLAVGLVFFGVLWFRATSTEQSDTALCEKLDRLVVKIEAANPNDQQQIDFWEDFRNDPPVCRTTP